MSKVEKKEFITLAIVLAIEIFLCFMPVKKQKESIAVSETSSIINNTQCGIETAVIEESIDKPVEQDEATNSKNNALVIVCIFDGMLVLVLLVCLIIENGIPHSHGY